MERDHRHMSADMANFAAGNDPVVALRFLRVSKGTGQVHANVDAPFKPLAPFVPDRHWRNLKAAQQTRNCSVGILLQGLKQKTMRLRNAILQPRRRNEQPHSD